MQSLENTKSSNKMFLVTGATFTSYFDIKGLWGKKSSPEPFCINVSARSEGEAANMARNIMAKDRGYCVIINNVEESEPHSNEADSGIDWDAPWFSELDIVAFDTETGGLTPQDRPIIEMAFVRYDPTKKDFEDPRSFFVDPDGLPIDAKARSLNGIDDAMLEGADTFGKIMLDLQRNFFKKNTVLVAHNRGFDAGFLYHSINRFNQNSEEKIAHMPMVCSMEMALTVDIGQGMNNKLGNLAKIMGVEGTNSHRAGDDALLCGRVFFALARRISEFKTMNSREFMEFFDQSITGRK